MKKVLNLCSILADLKPVLDNFKENQLMVK